ncbi:hypothetical protein [Mucilaginibacter aquariorum]|uniref:Uncharacterized protein n=1 Tax=Mucilaginibacter aquariorum TaxID=2967225 RepID=A0ABT1SX23_9SPHI|nr:hypothetical protein [Mucilaginibacter aquariorum]MCQ6956899.1 hypothetical protein [Mucilaginibacter aquariorum]
MLRIAIPSTTISAKVFEQHTLLTPPNGTETEVSGELVLLFEDEEEAVAYLDKLEDYSTELDHKSPEKSVINALVSAITNDEFVQAYLR